MGKQISMDYNSGNTMDLYIPFCLFSSLYFRSCRRSMDYFHMVFPTGILEGKIYDYFTGLVSEKGRRWDVNWIHYGEIKDADSWPDPNKVTPIPLVFTKVFIVPPFYGARYLS